MDTKQFAFLFVMLIAISFSACTREDNPSTAKVADKIQQSSWRVANFVDTGVNETVNYDGFVLTFKQDLTVTAIKGTDTINGTYTVSVDDDDDEDETELTLNFNAPAPWNELNDEWDISNNMRNGLEMDDMTGDDADDDDMHILEIEEID
jgi:hypothetical protein